MSVTGEIRERLIEIRDDSNKEAFIVEVIKTVGSMGEVQSVSIDL